MFIKREIEGDIREGARYFSVVAILGPRQSGKSTLSKALFNQHAYVSLEDWDVRDAARKDPRTFLITNQNEFGIIIDEFQYVPEMLSYIQTMVDEKKRPGYFVITGSQNFLMNQAISQTLAGRISIHTLLPLSVNELRESDILLPEIESILFKGCYPAIYADNVPPTRLYRNYFKTYVERDVQQLTQVGDLTTFETFMKLCAARVGQLLNISSLGSECGISDSTVKRWLSILEASYIIFLLQPYHTSFGKRLIKSPKIYFYDTGLACFLLQIKEEDLGVHPNRGNLFESFMLSDILKWFYNHGKMPSIYFWRDKVGHEIDCIIEEGKRLIPVEMKAGRTISGHFFKELEYWKVIAKQQENGYVVYAGSEKQIKTDIKLVSWQNTNIIFKDIT